MKKKFAITILCTFALIISSTSMYAIQTQIVKAEENGNTEPVLADGIFKAEIGIGKNKEPIYYLNGNYQKEDKILTCDGTVTSSEQQGVFTGTFKSDKKGYFEIEITIEEKTIDFKGAYKFEKNKDIFIGEWYNGGMEKCFEFVYPLSYVMPDGSIITGNSEKEIYQLIKDWYETYPAEKEKPILQYPVDIKYKDGTIVTINNNEEMKAAYGNCDNNKELGWITGTFDGMEDNSRIKDISHILARFPLLVQLLKIPIFRIIFLRLKMR